MDRNKQSSVTNENSQEGSIQPVISPRQSASLIASTMLGVGVLTLPRAAASEASEAAWITVILGAFFAIIAIVMITRLGFRFPQKDFVQYSTIILGTNKKERSILGRILSTPFILVFLGYSLVTTALIARSFGEVVVNAVLRDTPLEVVIATMLITSLILVMYDIEVLARVNEILLPIIVIPVLFIALFSFQSFELVNLLPVWPQLQIKEFLSGVLITFFAYQGYEIITIFSAHTFITKKTLRLNIIGLLIPAFIYTFIVIAGVSVFGNEELALLMWPTLELVKVTQVPGLVLERMESAFLGVWVAAVFTTTANLYYVASYLFSQYVGGMRYRRWFGLAFLPLIFLISLGPQNVIALFDWQQYIGYTGMLVGLIFPLILTLVAKLRKKGVKQIPYQEEKGR